MAGGNTLNNPYYLIIPLAAGYILDIMIGDPLWLPHPVRLFGVAITFSEKKLNHGKWLLLKGILISIILIMTTWLFFHLVVRFISNSILYYPVASILVFYSLANRCLISEALKTERILSDEGVKKARIQLSNIVGRDTAKLNENQVRTAILETLSENLSDGVIAPLFYFMVGGIPLMLTYKMVNTLDSMIGYKTKRYRKFGCFAARTDDVLNFIPARFTALLISIVSLNLRSLKFIFLFGNKHTSPNAGYPEAALSGALNCRFGGSNIYHNKQVIKPFIGYNNRKIKRKDIIKACIINFFVSILFTSFIILYLLKYKHLLNINLF